MAKCVEKVKKSLIAQWLGRAFQGHEVFCSSVWGHRFEFQSGQTVAVWVRLEPNISLYTDINSSTLLLDGSRCKLIERNPCVEKACGMSWTHTWSSRLLAYVAGSAQAFPPSLAKFRQNGKVTTITVTFTGYSHINCRILLHFWGGVGRGWGLKHWMARLSYVLHVVWTRQPRRVTTVAFLTV